MHNFKEIEENVKIVESAMLDKFPNDNYTITILLWTDNTTKIECRHGSGDGYIHDFIFYKGELTYEHNPLRSSALWKDESGNTFPVVFVERKSEDLDGVFPVIKK